MDFRDNFAEDSIQEVDSNIPLKSIRDRLFKIHKDLVKYSKEIQSFHRTLEERMKQLSKQPEEEQDIRVMEAALREMKEAAIQVDKVYNWVSFLNDYGPIADN